MNAFNLKIVKIDEYFNVTLLSNSYNIFEKINSTSMINPRFFKFQIIKAFSYEKIPCENFTIVKLGKGSLYL